MKTSTWIKLILGLGTMLFVAVGTYVVFTRLDDQMISYLVGGLFVLVTFVVVGVLLVGKDLVQAYIIRRTIAEDDLGDMKQMVFLLRMMGGLRQPNVNVRLPEGQQSPQQFILPGNWGNAPQQGQPTDAFDGQYEDTTIDLE